MKKTVSVFLVIIMLVICTSRAGVRAGAAGAAPTAEDGRYTRALTTAYTVIAGAAFAVNLLNAERTAALLLFFLPAILPPKTLHYSRNGLNTGLPETLSALPEDWLISVENETISSACHQFGAPLQDNIKAVSPDGKREAVFTADGILVTDARDAGTYNFAPSIIGDPFSMLMHFSMDMLPWLLWGNSELDTTSAAMRFAACFE